jgi:hypothetical protein
MQTAANLTNEFFILERTGVIGHGSDFGAGGNGGNSPDQGGEPGMDGDAGEQPGGGGGGGGVTGSGGAGAPGQIRITYTVLAAPNNKLSIGISLGL